MFDDFELGIQCEEYYNDMMLEYYRQLFEQEFNDIPKDDNE